MGIQKLVDHYKDLDSHATSFRNEEDQTVVTKYFTNTEVKTSKDNEMIVEGWLSRIEVDRDGDILDPVGADLKHFKKNPVVLFAHNYNALPIGKALSITKKRGQGIHWKVQFADTQEGRDVAGLFKGGFLNAFSIGFAPKAGGFEAIKDKKTGRVTGYNYTKYSVLEGSVVPVPANPEAVATQKAIASVKSEDVKKYLQGIMNGTPVSKDLFKKEDKIELDDQEIIDSIATDILTEKLLADHIIEENKNLKQKAILLKDYRKAFVEIRKELGIKALDQELDNLDNIVKRISLYKGLAEYLVKLPKILQENRNLKKQLLQEKRKFEEAVKVYAKAPAEAVKYCLDYLQGKA